MNTIVLKTGGSLFTRKIVLDVVTKLVRASVAVVGFLFVLPLLPIIGLSHLVAWVHGN